jgi:NitT/TauT family transport system ATP-binding protein
MSEISVRNISKIYASKHADIVALENVTFDANQNEFVAIVGPSGCGKSTLLKIIAGLDTPTTGEVRIGQKLVRGPTDKLGMVFQSPVLLPWRDVKSNIVLPLEIQNLNSVESRRKVDDLIELVGLTGFGNRYPFQLSGGMQQRVSLCRALVIEPDVLLMDEPFGALDAMTRERMGIELLKIWSNFKKTIIFVTHSIPEAVFLADRVLVMSARPGRILSEIKSNIPRPRTLEMLDGGEIGNISRKIRAQIEG